MERVECEAKIIGIKMLCECGGEMKTHGNIVLTTYPPLYPHECNKCHNQTNLDAKYPTVEFKIIG